MPGIEDCLKKAHLGSDMEAYIRAKAKPHLDAKLTEVEAYTNAIKEFQNETLDNLQGIYRQLGIAGHEKAAPQGKEAITIPKIISENTWHRGVNKNNKEQGDKFYSADEGTAHDYAINEVGENPTMTKAAKEDLPKNPLVVGSKEDLAATIGFPEDNIYDLKGDFDKKAKEYAQSKGHDAIVYESGSFDHPEMHVFEKPPSPAASSTTVPQEEVLKDVGSTAKALMQYAENDRGLLHEIGNQVEEYNDNPLDLADAENFQFTAKQIAQEYHRVKENGENPDLVKAVEDALSQSQPKGEVAAGGGVGGGETEAQFKERYIAKLKEVSPDQPDSWYNFQAEENWKKQQSRNENLPQTDTENQQGELPPKESIQSKENANKEGGGAKAADPQQIFDALDKAEKKKSQVGKDNAFAKAESKFGEDYKKAKFIHDNFEQIVKHLEDNKKIEIKCP